MSSSGHFGCTDRFLVIESGCPRLNGNFQGDFLARSKWQNDHSKLILIQNSQSVSFGHQQAPARNVFCITWISEMLLKQYCLRFGYFKDLWNYLEPKLHMELSSPFKSNALIYFPVPPLQIVMMFLVIPQCLVLIVLAIESHSLHQTFFVVLQPLRAGNFDSIWTHTSPSPLSSCVRVVRLRRSNGITIAYAAGGLCRRKLRCQKKNR